LVSLAEKEEKPMIFRHYIVIAQKNDTTKDLPWKRSTVSGKQYSIAMSKVRGLVQVALMLYIACCALFQRKSS
jgi:hypothetical protein